MDKGNMNLMKNNQLNLQCFLETEKKFENIRSFVQEKKYSEMQFVVELCHMTIWKK
jgi:hypothetical protein